MTCPCCKHELQLIPHSSGRVTLYCGVGRCPCTPMNDGAMGSTEAEAHDRLVEIYERWQDGQPEQDYSQSFL